MSDINKFTSKEVLNKVLLDSSGDAVSAFSHTTQEALNAALDATNSRLNVSLAGGTISGDVTIAGDLTVNGNGTGNYDEIVNGNLVLSSGSRLGIGVSSPDTTLHVMTSDASLTTADSNASVIIEENDHTYLELLTPNDKQSGIIFSNGTLSSSGIINYNQSTDAMTFNTDGDTALTLASDQSATFAGVTTLQSNNGNASYTLLKIHNNDNTGSGETGQTADIEFLFQGTTNGGSSYVTKNAGAIRADKVSDYHTSGADNMDSNLKFYTAQDNVNTLAMTIDSGQNIGIGMTPSSRLSIKANGDTSTVLDIHGRSSDDFAIISFKENASQTVKGQIKVNGSDSMIFRTGASTDALTIDSSQRVGIGTASPNFPLEIVKTGGGDCQVGITTYDNDATDNTQLVLRTADGTEASPALVDDGDVLGDIRFAGHDGSNFKESAIIRAAVDGDWSTTSGDNPTKLEFYTQDNGSGSELGTSNMVIRQDGKVGINEPSPDKKLHISSATSTDGIMIEQTGTGASMVTFFADGAERGFIGVDDSDGGAFLSSTSGSDYIMCLRSEQEMHFGTGGNNTRFVLDANSRISLSNNDSGGTGGSDSLSANTILGHKAGEDIASGGVDNTYFGHKAGSNNATGGDNVFIGSNAGKGAHGNSNSNNVGIGSDSMLALTTGNSNTVMGQASMKTNTSGSRNVGLGQEALFTNATTHDNTSIGYQAGYTTTGADNVYVGAQAGKGAAGAEENNVGVGSNSLKVITSGSDNVAIGKDSLASATDSDNNSTVGFSSGKFITTGQGNSYLGSLAGQGITGAKLTGNSNTAVGHGAGLLLQGAADSNVLLGASAGDVITTGEGNIVIGKGSDTDDATATNQAVIGYNATGQADNSVTLGNASVTDVYMAQDSGATVHCAGIQFPATQVANGGANVLDDYEEGFYTVTLTPSTSGSITVSSSYDTASYTKIGRQVTVTGAIDTSAISSPVGFIKVNVPFTIGANTELSHRASGSVVVYSASSNIQDYMVFADGGEAYFRIYLSTGTTLATTSAATIDASTSIAFTFTYFV
jgi:hypothetical protein